MGQGQDRENLTAWRRIALDKQLPRPRLLAGVGTPSLVALCLVVALSLLTLALTARLSSQRAPRAVIDSQKALVTSLAHALNVTVSRARTEVDDLARVDTAAITHDAAALLARIETKTGPLRGLVILDATTRSVVAAKGDPITITSLPPDLSMATHVAIPAPGGGAVVVLTVAPIAAARVLVGSSTLQVRPLRLDPQASQTVLLWLGANSGLGANSVLSGQGKAISDAPTKALISRAVSGATGSVRSVTAPVTVGPGRVPLATAGQVSDLQLWVVSTVVVTVPDAASPSLGIGAAGALLLAGLVGFGLTRLALVRPVRKLLARAKAAACGEADPQRRSVPGPREGARIANALNVGGSHTQHRSGVRYAAAFALVLATLPVELWSGLVLTAGTHGSSALPTQIVADVHNRVTDVASSVHDTFEQGLRELIAIGTTSTPTRLPKALQRLVTGEHRYRDAYVVDKTGAITSHTGDPVLRHNIGPATEASIALDPATGPTPIIFGQTPLPDGSTLVAEFDLHYLATILKRVEGTLRLVDADLRTVAATEGFIAFEPLSGDPLRAAATAALAHGANAVVTTTSDGPQLVAASPVNALTGGKLRLALVAHRPVGQFTLPANESVRIAWLIGFVAASIATLTMVWQYYVIVRPLRRLAAAADRLAAGDTDTVISPMRHDDLGSVAMCLEICRQAHVYGEHRFGGAVRLRGHAGELTQVLPVIPTRRRAGGERAVSSSRWPEDD